MYAINVCITLWILNLICYFSFEHCNCIFSYNVQWKERWKSLSKTFCSFSLSKNWVKFIVMNFFLFDCTYYYYYFTVTLSISLSFMVIIMILSASYKKNHYVRISTELEISFLTLFMTDKGLCIKVLYVVQQINWHLYATPKKENIRITNELHLKIKMIWRWLLFSWMIRFEIMMVKNVWTSFVQIRNEDICKFELDPLFTYTNPLQITRLL